MTKNCLKPFECEKIKNNININHIIDKMLVGHTNFIQEHIQNFLDAGGKLKALTISRYADGTLILRSADRTVVTVQMVVAGRKFDNEELVVEEE